ncbi:hypothetical protein ACJMK2_015845 [Sinanodonta woodiana]|uniref:Contactin n=1 Tax=Sinanodonta woodiana TaxID=1069815 RepID=A0ABD3URX8_SINWO
MMLLLIVLQTLLLGVASQVYECPSSWVSSEGRCYLFVFDPMEVYEQAKQRCQTDGADLLSIDTFTENTFITNYLRNVDQLRGEWYTSGERDTTSRVSGMFLWRSTGQYIPEEFNFWITPSEKFKAGTNIVYRGQSTGQYSWALVSDTSTKRPFICEISQSEVYRIFQSDRGFDYGLDIKDPNLIPRGPKWRVEAKDTIIIGDSSLVYLECDADGYPVPTFTWTRNSSLQVVTPALDTRYTITNGRLTIQAPKEVTDAGVYQCSALNPIGSILGAPVRLSFANLGEFSNVVSAPVTPKEYQGAAIDCPTINSGYARAIRYQWLRFPNQFLRPELNTYQFISYNGKLYFSEVTRVDEGTYFCVATLIAPSGDLNYVGSSQMPSRTSKGIVLSVLGQGAGDIAPVIQNGFISVYPAQPLKGETIHLECFAYGTSPLIYSWTTPVPRDERYILTDNNRVLSIVNVTMEDSGTYTCKVENKRLQASDRKSYTLLVEAKPYFVLGLNDQFLDVGTKQLTWRCEARGLPYPLYSWYKNGKPLVNASNGDITVFKNTLVIRNVDKTRDEGIYQCSATNSYGTAMTSGQLQVLSIKPNFFKNPMTPTIIGAEGGNITILCQPEAAPFPVYTWKLNGNVLNTPEDTSARVRRLKNGNLVITMMSRSDEGTYTCRVENSLGFVEGTTFLSVQGSTKIFQAPANTYVLVNETAFLYCKASYNQAVLDLVYEWRFNGRVINFETDRFYARGTPPDNTGGLYIRRTQYDHEGTYTCVARTQVDFDESKAELTVNGPPGEPAGVYTVDLVQGLSVNATDVVLRWTDPLQVHGGNIESYIVDGMTNYTNKWMNIAAYISLTDTIIPGQTDSQKRQFIVRFLKPGAAYKFRVRAVNRYGVGVPSAETKWRTINGAKPVKVPENVGGGGGSVGTLRITWTPLSPEDQNGYGIGYRIRWRKQEDALRNPQAKWDEVVIDGDNGEYSQTVGRDNFYMPYQVEVIPRNMFGEGPAGRNNSVFSAEDMPIAIPIGVYVDNFNESSLIVTWDPIQDTREIMRGKLAGFKVIYWRDNETESRGRQAIFYGNMEQALIIGLTPNTWYFAAVLVFNHAGNGLKSLSYKQKTDKSAPKLYPTEVYVSPYGPNSVKVVFRGVITRVHEEQLLGYKLRFWKDSDDIRNAEDVDVERRNDGIIYGIQSDTLYHLRVLAYSLGGDGAKSSPTVLFTLGGQVRYDPTVSDVQYLTSDNSGGLSLRTSTSAIFSTLSVLFLCLILL